LILFFSASLSYSQNYIVDTAVSGLIVPVAFEFIPGTNNVIVTHQTAYARIYNTSNGQVVSVFWIFVDSLNSIIERGVLGVCTDPNYNLNQYIYIFYTHSSPPNTPNNQRARVVRFKNVNNTGTQPFIVLDYFLGDIPGYHVGGNIRFGADGKLYITLGETGVSSNSQLLTNPRGKILRINSDGTIPSDNPFYDDGNPSTGNDDRIWVYGLRNSFDFCRSPVNDSLYASENGYQTFDEVNFIKKGKNYGWPNCEGFCSPYNPFYKNPMHVWSAPVPAVTGIMVYSGTQFPWLNGSLLVADNNYGRIYKCDLNNSLDSVVSRTQILSLSPLTTIKQGPDGFIYALNGGYTSTGKLYRIKPGPFGIIPKELPVSFSLKQNYPNPFNPSTTIEYTLAEKAFVSLRITDILGNEISTLDEGIRNAGEHKVVWNAEQFPSGIFFYSLNTGGKSIFKKMILMK
jgi:glucose/arabinose dehydrogenase